MKDKISVQEVEYLSDRIEEINQRFINEMTLDEIKKNLDSKIKPEVDKYLKDIFKNILCISEKFKYTLDYTFEDDEFNIEIMFSSDDVY